MTVTKNHDQPWTVVIWIEKIGIRLFANLVETVRLEYMAMARQ